MTVISKDLEAVHFLEKDSPGRIAVLLTQVLTNIECHEDQISYWQAIFAQSKSKWQCLPRRGSSAFEVALAQGHMVSGTAAALSSCNESTKWGPKVGKHDPFNIRLGGAGQSGI